MPASDTSATTVPSTIFADELRRPLALVVLVVGDERRLHPVALEQHARAARVLARDEVRLAQRGEHAQRHVLEVADRRRADDEAAAGHDGRGGPHSAASGSAASSAAPIIPESAPN